MGEGAPDMADRADETADRAPEMAERAHEIVGRARETSERAHASVTDLPGSRAAGLEARLREEAPAVVALGGERWRFRVPGKRRIGLAALDGDRLRLAVSLPRSKAREANGARVVRYLERNAVLPAGVRIVRDHGLSADCMTAEIPVRSLDEEPRGDRGSELGRVMRRLSLAVGPIRKRQRSATNGAELPEALGASLSELGWICHGTPDRWSVELDVPGAYHVAMLERCGDTVRAQARLCDCNPESAAGLATAWLAWQVASGFALVKPVLSGGALGLEVALGSMDAGEVDDALGALSVALRACAREAAALASSTELAACYLRQQDISVP